MDKLATESFLKKSYPGWKDFMQDFIVPLFEGADVDDKRGVNVLNPDLQGLAKRSGISEVRLLAEVSALPAEFNVYDVTVSDRVCLQRNRVTVQQLIRKIVGQGSAFMVFHYKDDKSEWRFSFCQRIADAASNAKRHTFLLGEKQNVRTVTANFVQLRETLTAKGCLEDADLIKCFDVEALSKEFFAKYKKFYEKFVEYASKHDLKQLYKRDEKAVRDYIKKMMGRLVFLQFLQKKGWLGVPKGRAWGEGDRQFLQNLFKAATPKQKDAFLDEILEHIFFHALNDSSRADGELFDTKVKAYGSDGGKVKVPYLNGGLFESDQEDDSVCAFPKAYFSNPEDAENDPGLLDFFSQYNFTIDENDPTEAEVGVDPEMLSCIFENLLEDNKDKGAYYTPKAIVEYMCRESLTAYLQTEAKDADKEKIAEFVKSHDAEPLSKLLAKSIDGKLRKVKICDPAIGSGAFPMGLLRELQLCRTALEDDTKSAAEIKKEIIQNNIYGVDIEKGAVDIARLRFWLSLVVDEPTPAALPNLDFKIMQGNSLLESYKGVDLGGLLKEKVTRKPGPKSKQKYVPMEFVFDSTNAQDKIAKLIRDYFEAGSTERKKGILRSVDSEVRCYLRDSGVELSNEILCFQNDKFFLWHTWFNDVFAAGGFDIVIGNPPYIQLQSNKGALAKMYKGCGFNTFEASADIYCLFFEEGVGLLKSRGTLCYITSNKWMRSGYGAKLRSFFATSTNPLSLIDFAGEKIFESASVDTDILLLRKEENQGKTLACMATPECRAGISEFIVKYGAECNYNTDDSWRILSNVEMRLRAKISAISKPISELDICINRGLLSGFNDAFIIDEPIRNSIVCACKNKEERARTEKLIRPIIRGRDVERYGVEWARLYLLDVHNGLKECGVLPVDITDYPAVKNWLDRFIDEIAKRSDKGITLYNLRNCAYHEDFAKPKLVWAETMRIRKNVAERFPRFSYDESGLLTDKTCYIAIGSDLKYVLGILNSAMGRYMCYREVTVLDNGGYLMQKIYIEKLMIANASKKEKDAVSNLVDKILAAKAKDAQADTSKLESQIDALVYDLYGLTEEEIAVVEGK